MKWLAPIGLTLAAGGGWAMAHPPTSTLLLLGGDTDGYLAPCGCTAPMSGGIRRRVRLLKELVRGGDAVILENGSLVTGVDRHDQIKVEALAEALASAGVDGIHLTVQEAKLGPGMLLAIDNLAPGTLFVSTLQPPESAVAREWAEEGPFLVGGVSMAHREVASALGARDRGLDASVKALIDEAAALGKAPILLLRGTEDDARQIAQRFAALRLIQYRSTAAPASKPIRVGATWLVSPGEKGKFVLALRWNGREFTEYRAHSLYPDVRDDESAARIYARYLQRVNGERLLDRWPRRETAAFAGNATCGSCHPQAMKVWKGSKHALALLTLQKEGHHRDPDCVVCHVVGLNSTKGFRSEVETPQLKAVGCESCHGPGAAHSATPRSVRMGKAGQASCAPCHTRANSPNFSFPEYWNKIRHR